MTLFKLYKDDFGFRIPIDTHSMRLGGELVVYLYDRDENGIWRLSNTGTDDMFHDRLEVDYSIAKGLRDALMTYFEDWA